MKILIILLASMNLAHALTYDEYCESTNTHEDFATKASYDAVEDCYKEWQQTLDVNDAEAVESCEKNQVGDCWEFAEAEY